MRFKHKYDASMRAIESKNVACEGPILLLRAIDSRDPDVSSAAMRGLGMICFSELGEPNRISSSLILLFEHYAKFSDIEDVRKASLEALYCVRAYSSLRCITFELGSEGTRRYRDRLLLEMRSEIC